jgi:ABC-2 type transport system permease protein
VRDRIRDSFAGTGKLVRFALRRDRIVLPISVAALAIWILLYPIQYEIYYPTQSEIDAYAAATAGNAALEAFLGPGRAIDTFDGLTAWEMGPVFSIIASLFAMFMVVRHTRSDEEDGRTELLLSAPIGRLSQLAAALVVTGGALALQAVLWWVGLVAFGLDPVGTTVQVLAILGCALVFMALTAVVTQVVSHARSARGVVGSLIGAFYVIRGVGDLGDNFLTWLSPIGWAIATRPFSDPSWWVLLLPLAATVILTVTAFSLLSRRDLGAGYLRPRPGPPALRSRLPASMAFAWRIQRGALRGWLFGLGIAAILYGSLGKEVEALLESSPQFTEALFAGGEITDSYFATMLDFYAIVASGFVIGSALRPASEEKAGRAELVLASGVGKVRWATSHIAIAFLGAVLLMLVCGFLSGVGFGLAGGGFDRLGDLVAAGPVFVPATLVLGGVAVLSFGISPRASFLPWAALGISALILTLQSLSAISERLVDLSPFSHLPLVPAQPIEFWPLAWLTLIAGSLSVVGLELWRRRDLN